MLKELNTKLSARGFGAFPIFELHPLQIYGYLEALWELWRAVSSSAVPAGFLSRPNAPDAVLPGLGAISLKIESGVPRAAVSSPIQGMLNAADPSYAIAGRPLNNQVELAACEVLVDLLGAPQAASAHVLAARYWKHFIYAYLIENTRVFEISARLVQELLSDEAYGTISTETHRWLRTTEDFFFRDGPSSLIQSITSSARPDLRATRRNAYYRMFGIDLNHGAQDGRPYPFTKATAANTDFVKTLQELMRELWRGYTNATNQIGPNTTDDTNIAELIDRLQIMLNARRISDGGFANLAREELVSVTMMSWFELTVAVGSPVARDLKATASTPDEQLRRLGERVKLPAHSKSRSLLILAEHLPPLLTLIEEGYFDAANRVNIPALYKTANPLRDSVLQIVNHWSIATGADLKAVPTTASPR